MTRAGTIVGSGFDAPSSRAARLTVAAPSLPLTGATPWRLRQRYWRSL